MTLIETRGGEVPNVLYHGLRDEKLGERLKLEYTKTCYRTNPARASEIRVYLNRLESSRDVRRQRKTTPHWVNERTPYQRNQTPPAPHQQQGQPMQHPYQPSYQQGQVQNQPGTYNQQGQGFGQQYQSRRVNFQPPGTEPEACCRIALSHQDNEYLWAITAMSTPLWVSSAQRLSSPLPSKLLSWSALLLQLRNLCDATAILPALAAPARNGIKSCSY